MGDGDHDDAGDDDARPILERETSFMRNLCVRLEQAWKRSRKTAAFRSRTARPHLTATHTPGLA